MDTLTTLEMGKLDVGKSSDCELHSRGMTGYSKCLPVNSYNFGSTINMGITIGIKQPLPHKIVHIKLVFIIFL